MSTAASSIPNASVPLIIQSTDSFGNQHYTVNNVWYRFFINLVSPSTTLTGDVTGTGTGTIPTVIGNNKVTYAKLQQASTVTLLGNPTGVTANVQEITLGTGLSFSGSILNSTGGTVTSVALSLPNIFTVSGSPVIGSGTLTATFASQSQNLVFASPNGSSGTPSFRALVGADLPNPTASSLGGVKSNAGASNNFVYSLDTSGNLLLTQPQFSGIGGTISHTQLSTTVTAGSFTTGVAGVPSFSVYNSSTTTLTHNAFTKIQFQTKEFDIGTYFDATTNYRYTPLVAGIYRFNWQVWTTSTNVATSTQYVSVLYKNGSAWKYGATGTIVGNAATSNGSALVNMNGSTDFVEVFFNNGNAVNDESTNANAIVTYFMGEWMGPAS